MSSQVDSLVVRLAVTLYRCGISLLPADFRRDYAGELIDCFERIAAQARCRGLLALVNVTARSIFDLLTRAPRQHLLSARAGTLEPAGGWAGGWLDLRHALRRLGRRPSFSVGSVLTLALGMAAAISVFSLVNGVILNPLPYPEADQIVRIDHGASGLKIDRGLGVTYGFYRFYSRHVRGAQAMAMYQIGTLTLTGAGDPVRLEDCRATPSLLDVLRVNPRIGRWFSQQDAGPGARLVVVLSDRVWRHRFGADPDILGSTIDLEGMPHLVLGVMPAGFDFPSPQTACWTPRRVPPTGIGGWNELAVARLAPGVSSGRLEKEMASLFPLLREGADDPARVKGYLDEARIFPRIVPLKDDLVGDVRWTLWILLGTVSLVLLISVANTANLFLARGEEARREVALRAALGASRLRLLRAFLAESTLLASIAAAIGVAAAGVVVRVLLQQAPATIPRLDEVSLDGTVVVMVLGVTLTAALVLGLSAGTRSPRNNLAGMLRDGGRRITSGRRLMRFRNALVVLQVALALTLLIGSGLLFRTYGALRSVDPGFSRRRALVFNLGLPASRYPNRRTQRAFDERLLGRLDALPGVTSSAAIGQCLPLSGNLCWGDTLQAEGQPTPRGQVPPVTGVRLASSGYFRTLGIPVRGRAFSSGDERSGWPGVILSEAAAAAYFPGQDALGRRVRFGSDRPWHVVVGVAGNVRARIRSDGLQRLIYLPMLPETEDGPQPNSMAYVLATSVSPTSMTRAVRKTVAGLDPLLPVADVRTLESLLAAATAPAAFALQLIGLAAGIALLLGAVGVYSVVAFAVSRRTSEIGVRLALGARSGDVLRMVFAQNGLVVLVGAGIGLGAASLLTRLMAGMLYRVSVTDPASYVLLTGFLLLVAAVAVYVPARRASRLDPTQALRSE